jgi:recombination protein RecT
MLGKRSTSFITSVLQIVAASNQLSKAEPSSIYQAAAMAATLDLPLNNSLGFAYIIPYNQSFKKDDGSWGKKQVAQFQLGYKGFIQLAQRSGQFKTLSAAPIYEGQIVEQNPLTGYVFDFTKKTSDKVLGYASYFELINGFQKILFMTSEELNSHAARYSKTYSNTDSKWKTDFDAMATKTVLKLLLSKFAPLSVDMQRAIISDQSVVTDAENNEVIYIDNEPQEAQEVDKAEERMQLLIQDATSRDQLKAIQAQVPDTLLDLYNLRWEELKNAK